MILFLSWAGMLLLTIVLMIVSFGLLTVAFESSNILVNATAMVSGVLSVAATLASMLYLTFLGVEIGIAIWKLFQ